LHHDDRDLKARLILPDVFGAMLRNRFAPLLEGPLCPAKAWRRKGQRSRRPSALASAGAAGFSALLKMLPEANY
jgi:hypothetical protein